MFFVVLNVYSWRQKDGCAMGKYSYANGRFSYIISSLLDYTMVLILPKEDIPSKC